MEIETMKAFETFLPIFEFGLQRMNGSERRIYLAQIAKQLGYGGIKIVSDHFSIDFKTLQKGMEELESGNYIIDAFDKRGRKGIEVYLPNILDDIRTCSQSFLRLFIWNC